MTDIRLKLEGTEQLLELIRELQRQPAPRAFIDPTAVIHQTSDVWHFAVILGGVVIGHNCSIGSHTEIGRGTRIGNYTRIGALCFFPPNSLIGNNVFIGPGVRCADDRHPYIHQPGDRAYIAEPPFIDDGASIGIGAVLLPGVHVGRGAIIGAGALVTRDVPADGMVKGVPARDFMLSPAAMQGYRGEIRDGEVALG